MVPSRRRFLGTLAALGGLVRPAVTGELRKAQKRAILVWMSGGPSQIETWDPKPGSSSAGPHRTTGTAIPGVRFDEYMPRLARLADKLVVVRSVTSTVADHREAMAVGLTGAPPGRRPTPPAWPAAGAHHLAGETTWPAFVLLGEPSPLVGAVPEAGYLGASHDPLVCPGDGKPPTGLPTSDAGAETVRRRDALRDRLSADFRYGHDPARLEAHQYAFRQLDGLIARRGLFDLAGEPARRADRYGDSPLGRDCRLACRLVERGVPVVMVCPTRPDWDLHTEVKAKQPAVTARFDTAVGALIDDLIARGLWDHTLVVLMGEFGRSPAMNRDLGGRDHWAKCWSMALGGAGARGGVVVGATTDDGSAVKDRPVKIPDLLATFYAALGLDPYLEFDVDGRPTTLVDRAAGEAIAEALA